MKYKTRKVSLKSGVLCPHPFALLEAQEGASFTDKSGWMIYIQNGAHNLARIGPKEFNKIAKFLGYIKADE